MTAIIIAIADAAQAQAERFEKLSALPAVIGRAPGCDVIVADPYVAARQLVVRACDVGAGFEVSALDAPNASYINARALVAGAWVGINSGDSVECGDTRLTFYAPDHSVAPAIAMPRRDGFGAALARMPVAGLLFVAALAAAAGWSYLDIWSDEAAMTAAMAVSGAFFVIVIWSALWSVVGRLLTQRSRFALQLSLASLYVMVSLIAGWVMRGVDFLLSGNLVAQGFTMLVQGALLAALTYGCLRAATHLTARKRMQGAAAFAGGLTLSVISLGLISAMGFNPIPPFASTLVPSLSRLAPAVDGATFINDSQHLFDDSVLSVDDKAP